MNHQDTENTKTMTEIMSLKIIVEGHPKCGKTTFVMVLNEVDWIPQWIRIDEKLGLSFDLGRITFDDWNVLYISSVPRSASLDIFTQLQNFENGFLGCIVLVDSTNSSTFWWAENIVRYYYHSGYPYIVAANKQDLPEAWSLSDLRIALNVPQHVPVVPCVATDKESVKRVLITLLYKVIEEIEATADIIE